MKENHFIFVSNIIIADIHILCISKYKLNLYVKKDWIKRILMKPFPVFPFTNIAEMFSYDGIVSFPAIIIEL